jgi:hypothetical protein
MEMDAAPVGYAFWSLRTVTPEDLTILMLKNSHPRRARPIRIDGRKIAIWLRRQRR